MWRYYSYSACAALLLHLAQGACDYNADGVNGTCIDAQADATGGFTFLPRMPGQNAFYYAVDGIDGHELESLGGPPYDSKQDHLTFPLMGWWIDYPELKADADAPTKTEIGVFLIKSNYSNADGVGGCDNLIGSSCQVDIRNAFNQLRTEDDPIGAFRRNNQVFSCPVDMFDDFHFPDSRNETSKDAPDDPSVFYTTRSYQVNQSLPSGNASYTYGRIFEEDGGYEGEHNPSPKAAVLLMVTHRDWGNTPQDKRDATDTHISANVLCAELYGTKEEQNGEDNAALANGAPMVMLALIVTSLMLVGI